MIERLQPESVQTLKQLIKLHGSRALIAAIRKIEKDDIKVFIEDLGKATGRNRP